MTTDQPKRPTSAEAGFVADPCRECDPMGRPCVRERGHDGACDFTPIRPWPPASEEVSDATGERTPVEPAPSRPGDEADVAHQVRGLRDKLIDTRRRIDEDVRGVILVVKSMNDRVDRLDALIRKVGDIVDGEHERGQAVVAECVKLAQLGGDMDERVRRIESDLSAIRAASGADSRGVHQAIAAIDDRVRTIERREVLADDDGLDADVYDAVVRFAETNDTWPADPVDVLEFIGREVGRPVPLDVLADIRRARRNRQAAVAAASCDDRRPDSDDRVVVEGPDGVYDVPPVGRVRMRGGAVVVPEGVPVYMRPGMSQATRLEFVTACRAGVALPCVCGHDHSTHAHDFGVNEGCRCCGCRYYSPGTDANIREALRTPRRGDVPGGERLVVVPTIKVETFRPKPVSPSAAREGVKSEAHDEARRRAMAGETSEPGTPIGAAGDAAIAQALTVDERVRILTETARAMIDGSGGATAADLNDAIGGIDDIDVGGRTFVLAGGAIDVPCPRCGASVGVTCSRMSSSGVPRRDDPVGFHSERIAAADPFRREGFVVDDDGKDGER